MEENSTLPPERRCPACGATMPSGARFCGACGMESVPVAAVEADEALASASPAAPPVAPPVSAPVALTPPTPGAPSASTSAANAGRPRDDADGRVCPWCDAVNALDAVTCVSCGAVFPTPAGDEALERAAQARIQSMESELRQRRSGWWPFRAR